VAHAAEITAQSIVLSYFSVRRFLRRPLETLRLFAEPALIYSERFRQVDSMHGNASGVNHVQIISQTTSDVETVENVSEANKVRYRHTKSQYSPNAGDTRTRNLYKKLAQEKYCCFLYVCHQNKKRCLT